jgi:RNA polymerase sigma-70 factor (ECF subfamily)
MSEERDNAVRGAPRAASAGRTQQAPEDGELVKQSRSAQASSGFVVESADRDEPGNRPTLGLGAGEAPDDAAASSHASLQALAAEWAAAGRAAWPGLAVDEARFAAAALQRLPAGSPVERLAAGRAVHAADLWLAQACAAGEPAALRAFDQQYLVPMVGALGKLGLSADQRDELAQELRARLLVAAGGEPPRIAEFSGRADLRNWVRTAAVRAGIDLLRRRREVALDDEDELEALPGLGDDPELQYLKEHYRAELRAAVAEALSRLTARERLLLKYHHVDRLGVARLGALYQVHHATAARWLHAARDKLADEAQRLLGARLGMSPSELRSVARLVESQLDLSLRRLLAE